MTLFEFIRAHHTLEGVLIFLMGSLWGSFFNVCIYRIPEDKAFWKGRSLCRHCGKMIPWNLNIPIWSYFQLRGKTQCCHKKLSIQYPIIEIVSGLMFLGLYRYYGPNLSFVCYTVFFSWLLVISVIDLHHQIIPDELSFSGMVLGFAACFLTGDITWKSSLMGWFIGGGIFYLIAYVYEKLSGQEGLGGGDVKLLAMLGAWLGIESILIIIVLSTFLGSLVGIGLIAFKRATSKAAIPFGPFLAFGAIVYLLFRPFLLVYFYPFLY